ncbi:fungal-specific transcription factor domain-containing protein [Podospora appendiculata]|uniref:Fungal-specific transcription factor domain-containing protein n=1 Tax=Podospora appendiculata TaxID=314037 RepID=A0AAE1CEC2_9PEZI|nr:fungal-specific transcription factor domain-containing protein [Podospora appendiculata]
MPTGTRSTKGCWTCRLRRKKCDETQPFCQTCSNLSIACQGYGLRPVWMDRGLLEREEAQKIKAAIARSGQRIRRTSMGRARPPSISSKSASTTSDSMTRQLGELLFSAPSTDDSTVTSNSFAIQHNQMLYEAEDEGTEFSLSFLDAFSPLDLTVLLQSEANDEAIPLVFHPQAGDDLGSTLRSSSMGDAGLAPFPQSETADDRDTHRETGTYSLDSDLADGIFNDSNRTPVVKQSNNLTAQGMLSPEASLLLLYYVDTVLCSQFPFSGRRKSGISTSSLQWLQFLLYSSIPVMEVSLVLSSEHQSANAVATETESDADHNLGASEVRPTQARNILRKLPSPAATLSLLDEELKTSQAITACTCLLQTIYLEGSQKPRWETCLEQAAPYMQLLIDLAGRYTGVSTTISAGTSCGASLALITVPQMHMNAAKALLGHLAWLDILATASTNPSGADGGPLLGINPSYLLDSKTLDLHDITGCQDSVAKAICDISALRRWKTQAETNKRLSIIELATRGGAILDSLTGDITRLTTISTYVAAEKSNNDDNHQDLDDQQLRNSITLTFARAATIYLHVVMSGPNPHLEEIQTQVHALLDLFKGGRIGVETLRHVPWPLCVTACFATREEREALEAVCVRTECKSRKGFFSASCGNAMVVAEECHRVRGEEGRDCDWTVAMDSLGRRFLLG